MLITIGVIVVAMIAFAALEIWLFWRWANVTIVAEPTAA
jgi:hypothetical protein